MTNPDLFATTLSRLNDRQKIDTLLLLFQDDDKDFHTVTKTYQAAITLKKVWGQMSTDERNQVLDSIA